jgi:DNA-binding transcriptional MerR regulator
LRFIRRAKSLGYTLKEIATIMQEARKGNSPYPIVRTIIGSRIVQNRVALSEMLGLQTLMEQALKKWAKMSDRLPDGESICYLIETTGEL